MDITLTSILLTIVAGFVSVASPCVLPILPIIVTGTSEDQKYRPFLIVIGLAIAFISMGVVSTLLGDLIAGKFLYLEKVAGIVIVLFGILMFFNINLFKKVTILNRLQSNSKGNLSGLFLGLTLGLIWIPCIGPVLSSVLMSVASQGNLVNGIIMLSFYSLGFAIPMLFAGYSSQLFRQKIVFFREHPSLVRYISGGVLILFGIIIFNNGLLAFSI